MENNVPLRELTLGQILDQTAAKFPDNDAIVYVDRDFRQTYKEFNQAVDEMAKGLMALGIKKGEKVAIWFHGLLLEDIDITLSKTTCGRG